MNCPWCAKLNLNYKTILISGIYVCENDNCNFCETEEYFNEIKVDTSKQALTDNCPLESRIHNFPLSQSESNGFYNNNSLEYTSIDNVNEMRVNDIKFEFGNAGEQVSVKLRKENSEIKNNVDEIPLQNILKSLSFENVFDPLKDNITQQLSQTNSIDNDKEHKISNITQDLYDINNVDLSKEIDDSKNNDRNSKEIISSDKENTIKRKRGKYKIKKDKSHKLKLSVIDKSISDGLDLNFYLNNNKLFNWLRMPYFMKTHSKIVRILLLHLDVFKFSDGAYIDEIKREYSVCETIANQLRIDTVRSLCYQFLNKLYNIIDKIPDKNLVGKEIDERVICLLKKLFHKYDLSDRLKFEYKTELCCSSCGSDKSIESKDYILLMEHNKHHLKIHENKMIYEINCVKCMKTLTKTVLFKNVPQFVIFHCPKGLKEDVKKYENKIVTNDGRKLSVVAVVETGSKYPFVEVPENQMSWHSYDICDTIMDTRCRPNYCVHFRNKLGWFSLNGYKQFLCNPQDTLSIYSSSDVRFVVFGEVSDPLVYRHQFSIQDLINKYEELFKKSIFENIEKSRLGLHNDNLAQKPNKKSLKPKSKPITKLKKFIKTEENIVQFPRMLKKINCDSQGDTVDDENTNSATVAGKPISSKKSSQIPASNSRVKNVSSRTTSSSESYASPESENYNFPKRQKINNNEIFSQPISNNFPCTNLKSDSPRDLFSIDDLINKQFHKRSKNL